MLFRAALVSCLLVLFLPFPCPSQSVSIADSAAVERDVRQAIEPADMGIDAKVEYSAQHFESDLANEITYLVGKAQVKYKDITLEAGKITIYWDKETMIAEGLPDTANHVDVARADLTEADYTQLPVFSDGREKMRGFRMEYNFRTERGRVVRGRSAYEGGYYFGERIKRVAPKEFNIAEGTYTTCSKEEPHFHFAGEKMKIILEDKVVARPVVFFIGKIPIAYLPFALYSTKAGRHSGIIIPQFGTSTVEGRYLRNLGYYWATNEYMDMTFTLDFFERTGVLFRTHVNYALRYHFRGSIGGSITRKTFPNGRSERRWDLRINHSQEIDENTRFSINGSFISNNNFYKEFSQNRQERLNRQLVSNATLTKRWAEGKSSLTLNLSETKDLETGAVSRTLPRLQLNFSRSQFFPFKTDRTGQVSREDARWYNYIYYSYNATLVNSLRKSSSEDTTEDIDRQAQHRIDISFSNPGKLFGWLGLSQRFNIREDWFDRTQSFSLVDSTGEIVASEDKGFAARHLFTYTASANTKLFGVFNLNAGPLKAFRHVLTPSLSFSYQPDFSDDFWGYFQTLEDTSGNLVKRDRFGGTPRGEQASLNFGLNNVFQMKWGQGEKEIKVDLFTVNLNSGYNFAADSLKLRSLSTSLRANPRRNLGISMNLRHSFYEFDETAGREVDRLLWNTRGPLNFLRLTSLQFDARWSLQGSGRDRAGQRAQAPEAAGVELGEVEQAGEQEWGSSANVGNRFDSEEAFSALNIPWRASLAFSFGINKTNPTNPRRTAYVDLSNVELQLTKNWRIGYRLRYDIESGEVADQRISFYRDLHCWEAQFTWNPSGIGQGFYFRINIKAPHLRDIKIEHRGGTTSVFSPF